MSNRLPASVPLVIAMFAAVAAAALRAGARRSASREVRSTKPPPVTATTEDSLPQPAVTAAVGQMQDVFHELHGEGRHALCEVCADQHRH
jgi:pantothenate kinase type III